MNQRCYFFIIFIVFFLLMITSGSIYSSDKPEIFVQLGHTSGVGVIAVTPDGKYAVTGGADALKLWDVAVGREIRTFKGHTEPVLSVTISPDGCYVVSVGRSLSGDRESNCILWDLKTGQRIRSFIGNAGAALSAAFSPDGRYLITGTETKGSVWVEETAREKTIRVWDVSTGKEVWSLGEWNDVNVLAVTPDGRKVVANGPGHTLKIWELATGRQVRTFEGHARTINAIAISADGKRLISASDDHTVRVWDLINGREIRVFKKHGNYVKAAAISPNGEYAISGGWDDTLRFWNAVTGRELTKPAKGRHWITAATVTPDGKQVISGDSFGTIKLWDLNTGNEIKTLKGYANPVGAISVGPDDGQVISAGFMRPTLNLWDIEGARKIRAFEGYSGSGRFIAVSPDGRHILLQNGDITLTLWETDGGKPVKTLYGGFELFNAAAFHPDGRWVIVGGNEPQLKMFDVTATPSGAVAGGVIKDSPAERAGLLKGDIITAIDGAPVTVWSDFVGVVQKNPGQKLNFSVSRDDRAFEVAVTPDSVKVDDQEGKKQTVGRVGISLKDTSIRVFKGHTGDITCLVVTPDGRHVVSGSKDKTLKMWEVETGREIRTFRGHAGEIKSVAISADGRYAVSAGNAFGGDDPIRLWDLGSGTEIRSWGTSLSKFSWINAVAFSGDGRYVVSGGSDDVLLLWAVDSGDEVGILEGHTGWIHSVVATSDGRYILSGSLDGTTRVWDVSGGREVAQLVDFEDGEWIVITPEGYFNASPNGDRYLNVRVADVVYGIENYREAFFRPDLVKMALMGGSLKGFRNIADVKEPPVVSFMDTPTRVEKDEVIVNLKLTDRGGGIGDIRLYLNGAAVVLDSRAIQIVGINNKEVLKTYVVKLTSGINQLMAVAFNGDNSMRSNEARQEVTAVFKPTTKPSLYALVIGINEFKNPKLKLNYPVADAVLFAETLNKAASGLFEKVNIEVLVTMEKTTRESIITALRQYRSLQPDDLFVFFVASHGTVDDGEYFLITSNVGSTRTERLKEDAITQGIMQEAISNIAATKKLILIDTCNAGALGEAIQVAMLTRGMSEDTAIKILSRAVGSTVLSASTSIQEALEGYQGHGLFTYVLVEGLKGKADKVKSGYIRTTELADYVDSEVPELAEKVFNRAQYPTVSISGQSFPIGRVE